MCEAATSMEEVVQCIRNCREACYVNRYQQPLETRNNRIIGVDELRNGRPLVDDWRGQPILFISQAPSRQDWVDHQLSTSNNEFLMESLLPKLFPDNPPNESLARWREAAFWIHTANCYPYVYLRGRNYGRDRLPDMRCANRFLKRVIDVMKPQGIILMGRSATKFFANIIRPQIKSNRYYPALSEILAWQYKNRTPLLARLNNSLEVPMIVLPHAADWGKLDEIDQNAYQRAAEMIDRERRSYPKHI